MTHAQHTVVVDHPIAAVSAYLADGTNDAACRPDVISINHVSGSGVGAVYAQTMKGLGGRTIAGDFRITHLEEPVALSFEVLIAPMIAKQVGAEVANLDNLATAMRG